ncbi:LuxR C-terminal-related transcriptional regulator [Sphingomonas sp. BK235]|uniref:LuxR C-terminal-related transcriptional regulator n=1 Tax=Sphingomonas sp. BK235 TaxID=2512131 RepID=UPI00104BD112|nr:LuxR C-terminal-related transcriptional regulator [Sphingomonas sp. BK235]
MMVAANLPQPTARLPSAAPSRASWLMTAQPASRISWIMSPDRFAKLTTRQRESLRLYHQRYRVKEIARALAISENTVSGYLTEATALLDVGGRPAAAAALAAHEAAHPETRGRFSVGDPTPRPDAEPSSPGDDAPAPAAAAGPRSAPHAPGPLRLPFRNGDGNDLTIAQRLFWLGAIVFALVTGFGLFALFVRTLSDVVAQLAR